MSQIDELLPKLEKEEARPRYQLAAYGFMAVLVVYAIARGLAGALAKPFSVDELCTLAVARQGSLRGIANALRHGVDSAPPLFYVIEAAALKWVGNTQIALRLPSILAFACILVSLFTYVKRRSGEFVACVCAFLVLSTSLFTTHMTDGRSYSLVIACVAFAMVAYEHLPAWRWTVLFAGSLACAESLHYYALFAMIPFWVAEGVRLLKGELRWRVWAALVAGMLPLAAFWPLLSGYRAYNGSHLVFSNPRLVQISDFYGMYFLTDRHFGIGVAVAMLGTVVWTQIWPAADHVGPDERRNGDFIDGVFLVALIMLPFIALALVRLTHAILTARYTVMAVIGIIVAVGYALCAGRRTIVLPFSLFLLCSVGLREYTFWRTGHHPVTGIWSAASFDQLSAMESFIESAGRPELPIVFDAGAMYSQISYYSEPEFRERLVYLLDEEREYRKDGNDTMVKIMRALKDYFPMKVADYSEFTNEHGAFLVYSDNTESWMLFSIRRDGGLAVPLKTDSNRMVYLVRMGGSGTSR